VGCCAARRTFGTSWKFHQSGGELWQSGQEITAFNQSCVVQPSDTPVCTMHHFWAGGSFTGYEDSILRYYVDGESEASVVIPFSLGLGSDMQVNDAPWNAGALFGKTGQPSGVFHNYHVPFSKFMRVTVELGGTGKQKFWIILKGTSGILPRLGGETLPVDARARTFWQRPTSLSASERLPFVATAAQSGAVLMTSLFVNWTATMATGVGSVVQGNGESFLEGCVRGENVDGQVYNTFSSGTEDYFLGTYYFNRGKYTNPVAGVTDLDKNKKLFSAYRIHDEDPLFFENGLRLTWRNSDPYGVCDLNETNPDAHEVTAASFAFVYEWFSPSSMTV